MYFLEAPDTDFEDEHESSSICGFMIINGINRCIFTGTTISIGGCDKTFDIQEMSKAMNDLLFLPEDTKLFCTYEHTKANMKFCRKVEPENEQTAEMQEKYLEVMDCGEYTVPSVLKNEKAYNVFMRCKNKDL